MSPRRKTPTSRKSAALATVLAACGALAIAASPVASAQGAGSGVEAKVSGQDSVPEAYEPLGPLIGEWDVGPPGAAPAFVEKFSWGPNHAYVGVKVLLLRSPGDEHLHFEGLVVYNASTGRFDYLFVVEPGSLTQESGEFRVEADGTIVRDVVLAAASGKTANFRQTFRSLGDGKYQTTLMRQTGTAGYRHFRAATT
ncbi:MAG: hypothetical protein ABWZ41_10255 [Burkholderiales bacterium]